MFGVTATRNSFLRFGTYHIGTYCCYVLSRIKALRDRSMHSIFATNNKGSVVFTFKRIHSLYKYTIYTQTHTVRCCVVAKLLVGSFGTGKRRKCSGQAEALLQLYQLCCLPTSSALAQLTDSANFCDYRLTTATLVENYSYHELQTYLLYLKAINELYV